MTIRRSMFVLLIAVCVASLAPSPRAAAPQAGSQAPTLQVPNPGVPQIMTLEAKFVRVAYNNEGYVILGYQIANRTVGSDWIMLDVGITLMEKVKDYRLKRDALSLDTPDGQLPLPSIEEYRKADNTPQMLQNRMKVQRDSINYFPPWTHRSNRLGFFSDLDSRALPWDETDGNATTARASASCISTFRAARSTASTWLNVKFAESVVRVPFRLLTEEEEKFLGKNYGDIKKQVDSAFRKKK